jgi:DNA excision repair protein ERCC-4
MDIHPVIIIDSREQTPLRFANLKAIPGTLTSGDYSFSGGEDHFSVERKSVADLVACCMGSNRERFERELHRLRGYRFKRLLIVGTRQEIETANYRSNIKPQSVLHSLNAFECRYDVPVVFCHDPTAAAIQVESWVMWYAREVTKSAMLIEAQE